MQHRPARYIDALPRYWIYPCYVPIKSLERVTLREGIDVRPDFGGRIAIGGGFLAPFALNKSVLAEHIIMTMFSLRLRVELFLSSR